MFKNNAVKTSYSVPVVNETAVATISGEWTVNFQPDRGAPASIKVKELKSWTENTDAGVKYFSGTASYTKTISVPAASVKKGTKVVLDLGEVKNIAEVFVNGKLVSTLWRKPFRADITAAVKAGENKLEIKVTNLWVNRLIGDQQPGVTSKITYTTMPFYKADSPLLPSGLLGPVQVLSVQ